MTKEIWKDVVGFEDYFQISNFGRVYSKRTSRILKQSTSTNGYKVISSRIGGRNGSYFTKRVHRWVAEAFIDNLESKPFVNHKDGIKTNNCYLNLEWVTASENTTHAFDNGLMNVQSGEDQGNSKLTEDDVLSIRMRYTPYCRENGSRALAKEYNVHHRSILRCINLVTWNSK